VFTKKKVAAFVAACAAFLAFDLWVFSTLEGAYTKTVTENQKQLAAAVASSAPLDLDEAGVQAWLATAAKQYPDTGLLYVRGMPGSGGEKIFSRDPALTALFTAESGHPDFAKGVESASYLEVYLSPVSYSLGAVRSRLLFAPVPSRTGDEALGLVVTAVADGKFSAFPRLADTLALIFLLVFAFGFGIALFSRDPITGYAILALFSVAGVFVAYPLFEALRLTFLKEGRYTLAIWAQVLGDRQYLQALWGSVRLGIFTATFSTALGFLYAFVVSRTGMRGKKILTALATMPVISPPFSLTLSIILLFGKNGLITNRLLGMPDFNIYGLGGLTLVQTISMFPIAFLTLAGVLQAIDSTLEEASQDLNAGRWQTFCRVTLPLAVPGLLSSWLLVFTNSLADFANPLLLAGSYRVLSVESYIEVTGMNRLGNGAALSILLLLPTLTAFFVQRTWVSRKSFVVVTGKPSGRLSELASAPVRRLLAIAVWGTSLFIVALYGTIVAGCFVKNWGIDYSFTTLNIIEALQRGRDSLVSTATLAAVATPIAGLLSMIAAVIVVRKSFVGKRLLEALMMTPFAIPGTLIGISYILAFNQPPILLVGTAAIIVICYVVRELPVGLEGGVATLRQIDPAIEEAAADLGADQATVFRTVVLPLVRPAFISAMSYTFVRSMTAVSAIIFLISARWYHITIQIYNFSENIRFGLASVLSTALIVIVLGVFGLMRIVVRQSENLEKTISIQ
jgi:iron(III) transport system permease protein